MGILVGKGEEEVVQAIASGKAITGAVINTTTIHGEAASAEIITIIIHLMTGTIASIDTSNGILSRRKSGRRKLNRLQYTHEMLVSL